jgi:hypothetical protein
LVNPPSLPYGGGSGGGGGGGGGGGVFLNVLFKFHYY